MNNLQHLKLLYDETCIMFCSGIKESAAYDKLNSDTRFNSIRRSDIHCFYKKLQEKANLDKQQSVLNKERKRHSADMKKLFSMRRNSSQNDYEAQNNLEAERKRLHLELERMNWEGHILNDQQKHLDSELAHLELFRQNAKKHLIFENFEGQITNIWESRFIFSNPTNVINGSRTFNLLDLFHQKSEKISVKNAGYLSEFHELANSYVLLLEEYNSNNKCCLRLIYVVPSTKEMRVVQSINHKSSTQVFVDSSNPKKFILRTRVKSGHYLIKLCTLVKGRIEIGEEIECTDGQLISYFDGQLRGFTWEGSNSIYSRDKPLEDIKMHILDLKEKKEIILDVEKLPSEVEVWKDPSFHHTIPYVWVRSRCFLPIIFQQSSNYGVIFTDVETLSWNVLEFACNLPVKELYFTNGNMMICTERIELNKRFKNIYKFAMQKPDSLRSIAWLNVIELCKRSEKQDPYAKALSRLPFNSELQVFERYQ